MIEGTLRDIKSFLCEACELSVGVEKNAIEGTFMKCKAFFFVSVVSFVLLRRQMLAYGLKKK